MDALTTMGFCETGRNQRDLSSIYIGREWSGRIGFWSGIPFHMFWGAPNTSLASEITSSNLWQNLLNSALAVTHGDTKHMPSTVSTSIRRPRIVLRWLRFLARIQREGEWGDDVEIEADWYRCVVGSQSLHMFSTATFDFPEAMIFDALGFVRDLWLQSGVPQRTHPLQPWAPWKFGQHGFSIASALAAEVEIYAAYGHSPGPNLGSLGTCKVTMVTILAASAKVALRCSDNKCSAKDNKPMVCVLLRLALQALVQYHTCGAVSLAKPLRLMRTFHEACDSKWPQPIRPHGGKECVRKNTGPEWMDESQMFGTFWTPCASTRAFSNIRCWNHQPTFLRNGA